MEKNILQDPSSKAKNTTWILSDPPSLTAQTVIYLFVLRLVIVKANKSTNKGQFPPVTEDNTTVIGPIRRRMMASKAKCEDLSYFRTILEYP